MKANAQPKERLAVTLDSLFAMVDRGSTPLKLSRSMALSAKLAAESARDKRLPSIDASLSAKYYGDGIIWDRSFGQQAKAPIPSFGNDFGIQASFVVFAGKSISATIQKASLEAQLAELTHAQNRNDLHFLVAGYYLNLYKLYNQKLVFIRNIEQTDEMISQVKAKLSTGMMLDNDITRYELLRQNLSLSLVEVENGIGILNQQLQIALGLPDQKEIVPDSSVLQVAMRKVLPDSIMHLALTNRQQLHMAELHQQIANRNVSLAKADLYPSVTVVGADILTGPILVEIPPINKNLNYWFVGVSLRYNIGALYTSKRSIAAAQNSLNDASLAYKVEVEQAQTAIYEACVRYAETFEKLATYQKSFELATQNYSVIQNRYQNGLVLITEMLDASNIKLNAELQVVNARLDRVFCYLNLMRTAGML